jgi:hypothetical protein
MAVFPLTILLSLLLAAVFLHLFWREHRRPAFGSPEATALLPLQDEGMRPERAEAGRVPVSAPPPPLAVSCPPAPGAGPG